MIPVLTPAEMAEVDRAAPEPVEVLVGRAGAAVARAAVRQMGGTYGRRVVVVAGKGNNGADGREAAARLARRGVRVVVLDAGAPLPATLPAADLVVDAAYGTGFRGEFRFPHPGGAPVLAVDVPSGCSGLSGEVGGAPAPAVATVTFAALKPGLLLGAGPALAGAVEVVDIGLDVGGATAHLVEDADAPAHLPARVASAHKWHHAVSVVAGSPGMAGAAGLCAAGALRAGAGYVRLASPGAAVLPSTAPPEAVGVALPDDPAGAARAVLADLGRFGSLVVGPGLGRTPTSAGLVAALLDGAEVPVVVDGDALHLLGTDLAAVRRRRAPTILTPHDGEFTALSGTAPGPDRLAAARDLATRAGAVVLLKGPTTVVADPAGAVLVVRSGDERLATAGTGDVLAGVVAAALSRGAAPRWAAAAGAHLHGRAGSLGPRLGTTASDVASLLPAAWDTLAADGRA